MEGTHPMMPPPDCPKGLSGMQKANIALPAVLAAIYIPLVCIRVYVRGFLVRSPGWDDYTIIIATLLLIPYNALTWYSTHLGFGLHMECVHIPNLPHMLLYNYITTILSIFSTMLARISVALLLLRLFAISQRVKYVLGGFITFITIASSCCAIIIFLQCEPREKLWNPLMPTGDCWPVRTSLGIIYFSGVTSLVGDFALALSPIYFMWNVQIERRLKAGIAVILGLGVFTALCSLIRITEMHEAFEPDATYNLVYPSIFSVLEAGVAIIAATVPTLRPLFTRPRASSNRSRPTLSNNGYRNMSSKRTVQATHRELQNNTDHLSHTLSSASRHHNHASASGGAARSRSVNDVIPLVNMGEIGRRVDVEVV